LNPGTSAEEISMSDEEPTLSFAHSGIDSIDTCGL
jgi:hypothetical protein